MTAKNFFTKTLKILLYILCFVLFIVIGIIIFINTNYGKKVVKNKVQSFLQGKIKTNFVIGSLDYTFPKSIELKNVYIEDLQKDTLLYGERLAVELDMLKLIWGDVYINKIDLKNIVGNVYRNESDSTFNYQFLIDAFASKTTKAKDTTSTSITLKELVLNKVAFRFSDRYSGNDFITDINNLNITIDKFEPDKLLFAVNKLKGDGVNFLMENYATAHNIVEAIKPKDATTKKSNNTLQVIAKYFELTNSNLQLNNKKIIPQVEGFDAAHIDASNIRLNAKDIFYRMDSTSLNLSQLAFAEQSGFVLDTANAKIIYTSKQISATDLYIKTPQSLIQNKLQMSFDGLSKITANPKSTTIAANLKNTTIAVNDLYTLMPSIKKSLPEQKFKNNLIKLNTEINGSLHQLNVPMFQVQGLSGSSINAKAVLTNITDSVKLGYDVTVYNTHLLKSDLEKFITNKNGELPADITLTTHLKGNKQSSVADITIASDGIKFSGKADVSNIDNPARMKYNVAINSSSITKKFLNKFIPSNAIPPNIKLPDVILLKGTAKGDANNIEPNLILNGNYGMVTVKGYVNNFKDKNAAKYNLAFSTTGFALGKLLSQDSVFGNVTLAGTAKGRGFDYKKMQSDFIVKIQKAFIKNYNYNNINLTAKLNSGSLISNGNINDANLKMQYKAKANLSSKYPTNLQMLLKMDTVQLNALHLYQDTLNASFRLVVNAKDVNPKHLNLDMLIDSSYLTRNKKSYFLDSIDVSAQKEIGSNNLKLKSPIADMIVNGDFDYDEIGASILQYIDKYYDVVSISKQGLRPQNLAINGVVKKHPLVTDMVQGLQYEPIAFDGKYNSQGGDSTLNFHTYIPILTYQENVVDSGKININSSNNKINYAVEFNKLSFNKNTFYASSVSGDVANDSLRVNVVTKDKKNKDRFALAAAVTAREKNYTLYLKNDLLVNYKKWAVAPANKISYSPQGILVKNFNIQSDKTKIAANSQQEIPNSPIDIDITNFEIKDIASIANTDTLMASGTVNAKINVSGFDKKLPAFNGNITIDSFFFKQQPVGNIKINAGNQTENTVTATMDISGYGNAAEVKGNYYLNNEEKQFDADLNLNRLGMATVQAFTGGGIANSSGNINGKLQLSGNFKEPKWNGNINFDTTKFTIAQTGVSYTIDQQKILLNYPVINFEKFTIKDSVNNSIIINGTLTAQSISSYDLGLNIHSNDFILVNTPKKGSSTVYGFAAADADVNVSGNSTSPEIEGNITLNDKSDVAIVLPESNINKDAAKTVVRFIDRDSFELKEKVLFTPATEQLQGFVEFLNYNLNISINKNAALTIVIDPASGDELRVQGDAQLNAGVDPGGHLVLAGNYALNSGYYNMSYQFLKKKFNLLEGSTIMFAGSPTDAQVDITAEYIANAAPGDLLQNEISQLDSKMANTFNQKIPFRVLLYLKGQMKKPTISFDIQLPDESANLRISNEMRTTIENKLTQVRADATLTNKEIFSLLLLGRFVGEQSTDFFKGNGSGGGVDQVARESVTKLLSSALNEIASDLIKGIDVDLNLNSYQDFSTGDAQQRTDLNVAVSKSFLDNRLTVTAGKNFGVEGQDPGSKTVQQNNNSFPDLTLNYKLTKDGKYAVRAYRKDQFEVTVDGYVVETGVAFVVTYDYDKFKELFKKKNKGKNDKTNTGNE